MKKKSAKQKLFKEQRKKKQKIKYLNAFSQKNNKKFLNFSNKIYILTIYIKLICI